MITSLVPLWIRVKTFSCVCLKAAPADTRGTICLPRLSRGERLGCFSKGRLQSSLEKMLGPETLQAGGAGVPRDAKGQPPGCCL